MLVEMNFYNMSYKDQLVLTGELNDVGSSIRTNVDMSFRRGLELMTSFRLNDFFKVAANATYSVNKIELFEEVIYNYDTTTLVEVIEHENTDISFSPDIIAGGQVFINPIKNVEVGWFTKYVGAQFLDNTSNSNRAIDAYLVNDLRLAYSPKVKRLDRLKVTLLVNNILNTEYSSNGYSYSYKVAGDLIAENFYYPQAGTNYLIGLQVRF